MEQNLAYFNRDPKEFFSRLVTMDETWIHYYIPESRESHTSNIAQTKNHELVFESFPHPLYSPELTFINYYLFPNLKRWLCGRRLSRMKKLNGKQKGILESLTSRIVLFGRHRKVKLSLHSLYRAKRRVHWKIKPIFSKKINSCSFYRVNIKHPSIPPARSECSCARSLVVRGGTHVSAVVEVPLTRATVGELSRIGTVWLVTITKE